MTRVRRRQFIAAAAGSGIGATAGCNIPILGDDGSTSGQAGATDWTQLRGTAGMTGHSRSGGPGPDASAQFTAEFRNGIHVGESAPLVGDDGIYGVGKVAETYEMDPFTFGGYAFKCSREDGSEQWRTEIETREGEDNFGFFRGPPTACLGPDGLYVTWAEQGDGFYRRHIECRSREDGSKQWARQVDSAGSGHQPVIHGETLFVLESGKLRAFSTDDGSDRWQTDEFLYYQLVPSVGRDIVAVYNQGFTGRDEDVTMQLTAFDRSDGSERWSVPLQRMRGFEQLPTVAGDTVYIAEGFGVGSLAATRREIPACSIRALDTSDGSERWSYTYAESGEGPTMAGGATSVAVDGDTVYAGLLYPTATQILGPDGSPDMYERLEEQVYAGRNLIAVDRADGSLQWDAQVSTAAQVWPYLVVDDTYLYAKYREPSDEETSPRTQWYVVEKSSGEIRDSFGSSVESDEFRAFGVADGALYEHVGSGVRVWE